MTQLKSGQKWFPTRAREGWRTIVSTSGQDHSLRYTVCTGTCKRSLGQEQFRVWIERTQAELLGPVLGPELPPPPPITAVLILEKDLVDARKRRDLYLKELENRIADTRLDYPCDVTGLLHAAAWAAGAIDRVAGLVYALDVIRACENPEPEEEES